MGSRKLLQLLKQRHHSTSVGRRSIVQRKKTAWCTWKIKRRRLSTHNGINKIMRTFNKCSMPVSINKTQRKWVSHSWGSDRMGNQIHAHQQVMKNRSENNKERITWTGESSNAVKANPHTWNKLEFSLRLVRLIHESWCGIIKYSISGCQ
jgi:hypothetical protein